MAVFFRLLFEKDKDKALKKSVKSFEGDIYFTNQEVFQSIPTSPLAYWVDKSVVNNFNKFPSFESKGNGVKATKGLATTDDFRFIRTWWEVTDPVWLPLAKGGAYSPFYSDINLVINWCDNGRELKAYLDHKIGAAGQWSRWINAIEYYKRPGVTWPNATTSDLSVRVLPRNCIFSHMAPTVFIDNDDEVTYLSYLAVMNSSVFRFFVSLSLGLAAEGRKHYEVGIIQNIPMPNIDKYKKTLALLAKKMWMAKRNLSKSLEQTRAFESPSRFINNKEFELVGSDSEIKILMQINEICLNIYNIDERLIKLHGLRENYDIVSCDFSKEDSDRRFVSWSVGVLFGRFNKLLLNKQENDLAAIDPFYELQKYSPAMLFDNPNKNPVKIIEEEDLIYKLKKISSEFGFCFDDVIDKWIVRGFFEYHLKIYTDSRRQSPIYWPLKTRSGSYTLWVYYHRLTAQTLYTCVNNFVGPKLLVVSQDLNALLGESARSSQEEKKLAELSDLEAELKDFRDELLRIAKYWKPNLNDGVQITAAPLWKLFQHKAWQKKLKDTWEKLEEGDYDWAHLACSIWPERVLRKCHQDRSLAIAHDVEDIFWHEAEVPVKRGAKLTGEMKTEWQPKSLTAAELTELINQTITELK